MDHLIDAIVLVATNAGVPGWMTVAALLFLYFGDKMFAARLQLALALHDLRGDLDHLTEQVKDILGRLA